MVSRTSKKLPIYGRDHTFIIAEVNDAAYALEQAEKTLPDSQAKTIHSRL